MNSITVSQRVLILSHYQKLHKLANKTPAPGYNMSQLKTVRTRTLISLKRFVLFSVALRPNAGHGLLIF